MFVNFRFYLLLIISVSVLFACGEGDAPEPEVKVAAATVEEKVVQLPAEVPNMAVSETVESSVEAPANVVEETVTDAVDEVKAEVTEAISGDKPYQVVDGAISANAIEGWKTYNGGGCGACHGKGGIGAVGPNLGNSVTAKLTKEQFVNIVTNGKSGTMMRPHKTNKRVMDNMDNLYAYLVARGDDVLGPGNLIKLPLGK
jgi:mono/diheme cytochrome c family protein